MEARVSTRIEKDISPLTGGRETQSTVPWTEGVCKMLRVLTQEARTLGRGRTRLRAATRGTRGTTPTTSAPWRRDAPARRRLRTRSRCRSCQSISHGTQHSTPLIRRTGSHYKDYPRASSPLAVESRAAAAAAAGDGGGAAVWGGGTMTSRVVQKALSTHSHSTRVAILETVHLETTTLSSHPPAPACMGGGGRAESPRGGGCRGPALAARAPVSSRHWSPRRGVPVLPRSGGWGIDFLVSPLDPT